MRTEDFKTGDRVYLLDREGYHEGTIREETRYRGKDGEHVFHYLGRIGDVGACAVTSKDIALVR